MNQRLNIPSATPWAKSIPYSRAVRVGPFIAVSQTSSSDAQGVIRGGKDCYQQAVFALQNVEAAIQETGASLKDVVRVRIYLADFGALPLAVQAFSEFFSEIRPAISIQTCTMITSDILVEFEADAYVTAPD